MIKVGDVIAVDIDEDLYWPRSFECRVIAKNGQLFLENLNGSFSWGGNIIAWNNVDVWQHTARKIKNKKDDIDYENC